MATYKLVPGADIRGLFRSAWPLASKLPMPKARPTYALDPDWQLRAGRENTGRVHPQHSDGPWLPNDEVERVLRALNKKRLTLPS
jgi:hypothetical protein